MHGPRAEADKLAYQGEIRRISRLRRPGWSCVKKRWRICWWKVRTPDPLPVGEGRMAQPEPLPRRERRTALTPGPLPTSGRVVGVRTANGTVYRAVQRCSAPAPLCAGCCTVGQRTRARRSDRRAGHRGHQRGARAARIRVAPLQDRHAAADRRTHDRLCPDRASAGRRRARAVLLSHRSDRHPTSPLLDHATPHPAVHEVIRANLHRAPMFSGQIQSTGPRYCPSVETKIVRFAEKTRHQLFLEPEGRTTHEVYINGLSTSLPPRRAGRHVAADPRPGAGRNAALRICDRVRLPAAGAVASRRWRRSAWRACSSPARSTARPATRRPRPRGLMAGVNAALSLRGEEPLVLGRDQAYIGVMIDDLVTRGVDEPYRMFTSRAEYRLLLRPDNADRRLTPLAHRLGLVERGRWQRLQAKEAEIARLARLLEETHRRPSLAGQAAAPAGDHVGGAGGAAAGACRRPHEAAVQVTYDAKYAGYVARQQSTSTGSNAWRRAASRPGSTTTPCPICGRRPAKNWPGPPLRPGPSGPHQRHHAGRPGGAGDPPGSRPAERWEG